jgi:hypothetical protein
MSEITNLASESSQTLNSLQKNFSIRPAYSLLSKIVL